MYQKIAKILLFLYSYYFLVLILLFLTTILLLESKGEIYLPRPFYNRSHDTPMDIFTDIIVFLMPVVLLYCKKYHKNYILLWGKIVLFILNYAILMSIASFSSPIRIFPYINHTTYHFIIIAIWFLFSCAFICIINLFFHVIFVLLKKKDHNHISFYVIFLVYFYIFLLCGKIIH